MHGIDVLKEGALPILCHKCAPWQVNHIKNSQPWKLHQPHSKKIWIVPKVHQPPSENSSPPPLSLTNVVNFAQLGHLLLVLALAHFALHCVWVQYVACIVSAAQGLLQCVVCVQCTICAFNTPVTASPSSSPSELSVWNLLACSLKPPRSATWRTWTKTTHPQVEVTSGMEAIHWEHCKHSNLNALALEIELQIETSKLHQ